MPLIITVVVKLFPINFPHLYVKGNFILVDVDVIDYFTGNVLGL